MSKVFKQRFAVGDKNGKRSSEWLVACDSEKNEIYVISRVLGGLFKASIHASGCCHVKNPSNEYADQWSINLASAYEFPFGIIFPESDLRIAEWKVLKDKGTIWVPLNPGRSIEIAVFLIRDEGDITLSLSNAGWHTVLVNKKLQDERRLIVAAGDTNSLAERQAEILSVRAKVKDKFGASIVDFGNPRIVLLANDLNGTRRFVDIAAV